MERVRRDAAGVHGATLLKAEEAFQRSVSFAVLVRKGQLSAGLGVVVDGEQQVERRPLSVSALEIVSEALVTHRISSSQRPGSFPGSYFA